MFFELLAPNNSCTFNVSIANKYGLNCAIYLSEVIRQYYGEPFKINVNDIRNRTTLNSEKQSREREKLIKREILIESKKGFIDIDVEKLLNEFRGDPEKKVTQSGSFYKDKNEAKSIRIEGYLRDAVKSTNPQFREAMYRWIDSIHSSENSLSKSQVQTAEEDVIRYANGNLSLSLELLRIATCFSYRDIKWAYNNYRQDLARERMYAGKVDFSTNKNYNNMCKQEEIERDNVVLSGEVF